MKNKHSQIIVILSLIMVLGTFIFSGCQKSDKDEETVKNGNGITRVLVEPVKNEPIVRTIRLSGKAEGLVDIDVMGDISGRIVSLNKQLGDYVYAGQEIGRIESAQYEFSFKQAEAQLIAAEASHRSKEMQLATDSLLFKQESISEHGLLNSFNQYQLSLASWKGAQAQLEQSRRMLERAVLKSPATGYIAYLPIQVGENIQANSVIYSIVDDSQIIVRTGIGQNYINMVEPNDLVQITCNANNLQVKGIVKRVGRSAKIGNSLYPIEIEFKNPGKMKSGMIINLELEKATLESMIAVKFSVIEQRYDNRFVYLVKDNKATLREVKLGDMVGDFVIITEGLEPNDLVIVDSAGKLSEGQPVTYAPAEKE